jgi:hypothetical protein
MKRRQSINYVNNEDFYNRLVEWKESGIEKIPDDIALTIVKICENLAKSGKFCGYTWKDEMICDGIFSCCKFAKNFNPEKSSNPFAYFTQICWNSFIYSCKEYYKQINIKKSVLENYLITAQTMEKIDPNSLVEMFINNLLDYNDKKDKEASDE